MNQIRGFKDEHAWLSNFWPCFIIMGGIIWPSAENAYQAIKSEDPEDWKFISELTPGQAKRYGKKIVLRPGWHAMKAGLMHEIVTAKFTQNEGLAAKLIATGDAEIVEDNAWGDTYWGVYNGHGMNHLGRILMEVRTNLS